ncbi:MAG: hypothetical protein ACREIM_00825 [Nitrospiraceae bacterium]
MSNAGQKVSAGGRYENAHGHPGHNAIILSAIEDDQAERAIGVLREFRDHMVQLQDGAKISMRVFAPPCEQVV